MKKFIITEEEKNRILGMHQDHGYNSLNEQTDNNWQDEVIKLNPKSGKKTIFSKLPAVQVSQPNSEIFYTQNRWFQYPKGVTKGEPIIKGSWKLDGNKIVAVKDAAYNKPVNQEPAKTGQTKTQVSITDPKIINSLTFEYTYPGDTKFIYANQNDIWYGKNLTTNKVYNISKNYPASAKNLESKAVLKEPELPEKPLAPNPESEAGAELPQ
jgi:hypothetical protein